MGVIICARCGNYTNLNYDVTPVVLKGTTDFVCWECLDEDETCEDCGMGLKGVLDDPDNECKCSGPPPKGATE